MNFQFDNRWIIIHRRLIIISLILQCKILKVFVEIINFNSSIIIYRGSIIISLAHHDTFSLLYTLRTLDHNSDPVDQNLPYPQFSAKKLDFFLPIWSMNGQLLFTFPPKVKIFHKNVKVYSRWCPSICTIAVPGFHILTKKLTYIPSKKPGW